MRFYSDSFAIRSVSPTLLLLLIRESEFMINTIKRQKTKKKLTKLKQMGPLTQWPIYCEGTRWPNNKLPAHYAPTSLSNSLHRTQLSISTHTHLSLSLSL